MSFVALSCLFRLIELESALLEDDCNNNDILAICQGREIPESIRPDVWLCCMGVRNKPDAIRTFDEIFDLPFQQQLRSDCHNFVEKLGNEEEEQLAVVSDLESILTFYCKNRNLKYETNNGWIEMLLPLMSLKLQRSDTYNLFEVIRDAYVPKNCVSKGNVFHVLRLLLQYHDPDLCSVLDTKRITPDLYSSAWFMTLFAGTCTLPVALSMWDIYFQQNDPFLIFFMSLIMLINGRDSIIAMKDDSKETIIDYLTNMPCAMEQADVIDFCSLAQYYSMKTPSSFKTELLKSLFGSHTSEQDVVQVSQALCLPVSVYELVEVSSMDRPHPDSCKFFLVDCRPYEQYNAGHLSTAFHLDCNLMLQEPNAFQTAVQGLLRAQKNAIEVNSTAGGEHLCFMGSGREEEDQFTYMVIAKFLQKNTRYISLLTGGFAAIHDYFGEHMLDCLEDHEPTKCIVCTSANAPTVPLRTNDKSANTTTTNTESPSTSDRHNRLSGVDIFGKLSSVVKSKSAEVKGLLKDYIVNPTQNLPPLGERHVMANERHHGKRYRSVPPVFSIDDAEDEADASPPFEEDNKQDTVELSKFLKNADIKRHFKCQEVHMNGFMYDSVLAFTESHIIVLRELGNNGTDQARVIAKRPLNSIVKITAKKRHRDLITFKFGVPDGDNLIVTDMDRFLIPNAHEATQVISKLILDRL